MCKPSFNYNEVTRKSFPIKLQHSSNWPIDCDILNNDISAISKQQNPWTTTQSQGGFVTQDLLKYFWWVEPRVDVWMHLEASWKDG